MELDISYRNFCSGDTCILASTIVCWFSRRREFRADFGGANLLQKRQ